jgi:hypothetical protein
MSFRTVEDHFHDILLAVYPIHADSFIVGMGGRQNFQNSSLTHPLQ